eukprot:COSAG01_NODE_1398_length_10466_cov_173.518086_7_plen_90_part_00
MVLRCCRVAMAGLDDILAELEGLLVSMERVSVVKGVLTTLLGLLGWTLTNPDHTRIFAQVDSSLLEADLGEARTISIAMQLAGAVHSTV